MLDDLDDRCLLQHRTPRIEREVLVERVRGRGLRRRVDDALPMRSNWATRSRPKFDWVYAARCGPPSGESIRSSKRSHTASTISRYSASNRLVEAGRRLRY